ncbi:MAG: glycosyltransferase [Methylovirgula sp.]
MAKFFIVVPTFNSADFLERCLTSLIVMQPGEFNVRVHVQDGGSTDATLDIAERWKHRGVTFACEPDKGMYDALSKASHRLDDGDIMTWLGTDDYLMPGAIGTAAHVFDNLPHVNWITGRPFMGREAGENLCLWPDMFFTQRALSAGRHDGRSNYFVQQEGTFWRASLWNKVGGVDTAFKLAGDWDLWRRFAQHSRMYLIKAPLARFTRREGQKSQDMGAYYAEVDSAVPTEAVGDEIEYRLTRFNLEVPWTEETIDHAPPPRQKVAEPAPEHNRRRSRLPWLGWRRSEVAG